MAEEIRANAVPFRPGHPNTLRHPARTQSAGWERTPDRVPSTSPEFDRTPRTLPSPSAFAIPHSRQRRAGRSAAGGETCRNGLPSSRLQQRSRSHFRIPHSQFRILRPRPSASALGHNAPGADAHGRSRMYGFRAPSESGHAPLDKPARHGNIAIDEYETKAPTAL
jgi:hypothetical protein